MWTHGLNAQSVSVHYALWWKSVLLVTLDYLKMGLARYLIFRHDRGFFHSLCHTENGTEYGIKTRCVFWYLPLLKYNADLEHRSSDVAVGVIVIQ